MYSSTKKDDLGTRDETEHGAEQRSENQLEKGKEGEEKDKDQYPSLKIVIPTFLSICLAFFLTALDRTIVGVAIPAISNEFHSFGDISWYEAAFLLTLSVFQLPMGKAYKYLSAKWLTVASVVVFEIGSIVCAAAPSSIAFIIGRAITGVGAAGSFSGAQVIIRDLLPLRKRPKYQGCLGAVFGLSSILGPLVGGAFTSDVTWRWCFWISLPVGGLALVGLIFILPASPAPEKLHGSFFENLKKFDPIGNILLAPGLVAFLLAVQWGGTLYPWNDARVIAPLAVGSVLLVTFIVVQFWVKENGTLPPRILYQRSIASGAIVSLGNGGILIAAAFYLPIWFQAIENISARDAGIRLLPFFLSTVVFVIASGIVISKIGYYTPLLIIGCAILVVGAGLLTTFRVDTSTGIWVGYQIVVGAGIGLSLQQSINAAQTVLPNDDIPTAISLLGLVQNFGGTVAVSVAQTVLSNTLKSQLATTLPNFNTSAISTTGATDIRNLVPKDKLSIVLTAYNAGIDNVFYLGLAFASLSFLASLFMEWKSVRKTSPEA